MASMGSYRSDDCFSGDDQKAFVTFKGCMESEIAAAGKGTPERPFNQVFWSNEVEESLAGSARDTYVASRTRFLR